MELIFLIGIIFAIIIYFGSSSSDSKSPKNKTKSSTTTNHYTAYYTNTYHKKRSRYNTRDHGSLEKKRQQFEEMKQTEFFKRWRRAQYYECQNGKCAYCQKHIDLYSPNTQVDHIKPLCKYGTNEYDNLVLACRSCNYYCKKGDYTWRDKYGQVHSGWTRPAWIKDNPVLANAKEFKARNIETDQEILDLSEIPF